MSGGHGTGRWDGTLGRDVGTGHGTWVRLLLFTLLIRVWILQYDISSSYNKRGFTESCTILIGSHLSFFIFGLNELIFWYDGDQASNRPPSSRTPSSKLPRGDSSIMLFGTKIRLYHGLWAKKKQKKA